MSLLTLWKITKDYDGLRALDDVSFNVDPGERVALLGHNGAGKSTLIKIVLGLIPASAGTVAVLGATPGSATARGGVAYLPENVAFHSALTAMEHMGHYLALRGRPKSEAAGLLDQVDLAAAANRRVGTYSKGMRQRLGLAQALIGAPKLLILDEPTSGLDPISRRSLYAILDRLAANGAGILLSSHALSEVEGRSDRVVILSRGRRVADDTLAGLQTRAGLPMTLTITPADGALERVAAAFDAPSNGGKIQIHCAITDKMGVLGRVNAMGADIRDVDFHAPSLDDIYAHLSAQTQHNTTTKAQSGLADGRSAGAK